MTTDSDLLELIGKVTGHISKSTLRTFGRLRNFSLGI